MLKYQKGYIFNGLTFVVNKEDVHNAKDEMFVEATALLPMVWPPTNADRFRAMSNEELVDFLREIYDAGVEDAVSYEWGSRKNSWVWNLDWLQQPAEE